MRSLRLLLLPAILLAQADSLTEQAQRARQAMTAGRYREAAALYEKLAASLPQNAGLRMNVGLALHSAGDYASAIRHFEEAVKRDPRLAPAWLLLGVDYQKLGQPRKAVAPIEKAIALEPQNQIARLELADAYYSTDRFESAASEFRKLTDADSRSAKAWQGLGLSYLSLSRREFQELETKAPESAYWYALLARSKLEQGQHRTAFTLFRKALEKNPTLRGAHQGLAEVYERTGHPDWAAVEARREQELPAAASKVAGPEAQYRRAQHYSALAAQAFEKLAELPDGPEIHELRAETHHLAGRHADALNEFREALRLALNDARMQKGLARALVTAREYAAAEPLLKNLLAQNPASPELNLQLGRALFEQQMSEQALPYLQRAAPESLEAKALLGRVLLQLGRASDAIPPLLAALTTDSDGSLHYQLSIAYRRTGQDEKARRMIEEQRKKVSVIVEKEIAPP